MVDFRKWLPALAIVALLLGTSVMVSAQTAFTCSAQTGVTPLVRGEGLAELVGDVVLQCTGGTVTPVGSLVPRVNFAIFLNTNITSRVLGGGVTEALMMIDEPAGGPVAGIYQQNPCNPTDVPAGCAATSVGGAGLDYRHGLTAGVFNTWYGSLVQQGGQQYLSWTGIPVDPPGTTGTRTIRFTNIRGNAKQIGFGSTFQPAAVSAFISITSPSSISLPNPIVTVAYVAHGLGTATVHGGGTFAACLGHDFDFNGPSFTLDLTEGFASGFKRLAIGGLSDATVNSLGTSINTAPQQLTSPPAWPGAPWDGLQPQLTPQDSPGQVAFTESGFVPAFATPAFFTNAPGAADSGTRFLVTVGNVPAGVSLYAGLLESSAGIDPLKSRIRLISTSSTDGSGSFSPVPASGASVVAGFPVTKITSGGVLTYEIVTDDPSQVETLSIPFYVVFPANGGGLTPANGLPTVAVTLAPTADPVTGGIETTPSGNGLPIPRFVDGSVGMDTFQIQPCQTNILFPWVVNQDGFDTGLAIANTSADPYGTINQSGNCTIYYYGETTGGGAAPNSQTTDSEIAAGGVLRFVVSTGGTNGIAGTPGFLGYIIATCDFQYGHGFAFITDGPIGQAHVAEGYLGLILDKKLENARPKLLNQSESLSQ